MSPPFLMLSSVFSVFERFPGKVSPPDLSQGCFALPLRLLGERGWGDEVTLWVETIPQSHAFREGCTVFPRR